MHVLVWLLQADTGAYVSVVTPGRHRCICQCGYSRQTQVHMSVWLLQVDTGACVSVVTPGRHRCIC